MVFRALASLLVGYVATAMRPGDNPPYSPRKEVEDIAALIEAAGGKAPLCGFSSGAALAMEAALALGPERVAKLAMYEPPYTTDPVTLKEWQSYGETLLRNDGSNDTEALVMASIRLVHAEDQVDKLRKDEATWKNLSALAPTLIYDYQIVGPTKRIPRERLEKVDVQTLVMCAGDSGSAVAADIRRIAGLLPHGPSKILPGQSHNVEAAPISQALREFFA